MCLCKHLNTVAVGGSDKEGPWHVTSAAAVAPRRPGAVVAWEAAADASSTAEVVVGIAVATDLQA